MQPQRRQADHVLLAKVRSYLTSYDRITIIRLDVTLAFLNIRRSESPVSYTFDEVFAKRPWFDRPRPAALSISLRNVRHTVIYTCYLVLYIERGLH
jgi:hypothetical protein